MITNLSATEFRRKLAQDPELTLIDVRTPAEFRELHVVGAQNKPLDRLQPGEFINREGANRQGADGEGPLHVICRSGSRGMMACEKLVSAGIKNIIHIEGGTLACEEAGIELVRGKKAMSLERQVRVAAGSLVVIGALLGGLVHPAWITLSGFVGAGLVFAGVTDTCGMGMLLARMPWNQVSAGNGQPAASSTCNV